MPVCLRIEFDGATSEQYDNVHTHMGIDEDPPDGLIFHFAGPVDGGWRVTDVWESRDHFDRFAGSRLMPAVQELGDRAPAGQPDITEFPVHHFTKP